MKNKLNYIKIYNLFNDLIATVYDTIKPFDDKLCFSRHEPNGTLDGSLIAEHLAFDLHKIKTIKNH